MASLERKSALLAISIARRTPELGRIVGTENLTEDAYNAGRKKNIRIGRDDLGSVVYAVGRGTVNSEKRVQTPPLPPIISLSGYSIAVVRVLWEHQVGVRLFLSRPNNLFSPIVMYAINVDWREEYENWNFIGQHLYNEEHEGEEDFYEDNEVGIPMMNYAYPLNGRPNDEQILDIVENTACTVVERESDGEFYLALTGGGMDLSQSIALAYLKAGEPIPLELCREVSTQVGLSISKEEYIRVFDWILENYEGTIRILSREIEEIRRGLEQAKKGK